MSDSSNTVAPQDALARIPDALRFEEAGPLMCAGTTTFNSLRHSGARPGDTVAIHGVGGLGHLAVQFAAKMGFRTVAINRGRDREALVRRLGADEYIDSNEGRLRYRTSGPSRWHTSWPADSLPARSTSSTPTRSGR
jgi:D-arabinose 1-dehydrogenase-like Zn-dependent alcohol dehydrogenase